MTRITTITLLAFAPLFAADQVVLTNGDTITGTIVKKDGDKLTIKSEFLGEVSMPWAAVKSVKSESDVYVQLPAGEIVQGKLATSGDQLQVTTSAGPKVAPLAQIAAVRDAGEQRKYERLLKPGLLELWYGKFDLGYALARGNARTNTVAASAQAARETRSDTIALYFNTIRASARVNGVTSQTASAIRGGWKYNRNLTPRFFLTAFNDYEHDRFQNLDLRFVIGGGAGYKVIKSERTSLDVDAGADYDRENFFNGLHRNFAELNFGNLLLHKVTDATSITQSFRMFNNMTNTGEYRINFDFGAVTAVRKWFGFHITASDRFLSNPVQGRQRNDVLLTTGVRISFAK
jgi:putative salt-induced outer membrane protein YdiY